MREAIHVLELTSDEYKILLRCLIHFRNTLIYKGRYTDAVDELLLKLDRCQSRRRWFR